VGGRPWTHYAAPAAFLLAVTVAVLVVRSGLETAAVTQTQTVATPLGTVATTTVTARSAPATQTQATTPTPTTRTNQAPAAQFYTVVSGDTFGVISSKTGVAVAELERLNPNVESTALYIGQRIRIK
jgi:LysM repeat protein